MTLQAIILLALKASIILTVFSIGLESTTGQLTHLLRHPRKLVRSLVAMNVIMPVFAIVVALVTSIPTPVKVALIALSVAPVPPLFPKKASKTSDSGGYIVGLLFAASLLAIVIIPVTVAVVAPIFGVEANLPASKIAGLVLVTLLVPLGAGVVLRSLLPKLAHRFAGPLSRFASLLLLIALVPVLFVAVPQAAELAHDGSILAFAAFVLVGLAVGHWLGGPDPDERTVLAIATSSRHPGIAMAIAAVSAQDEKVVLAAIVLYLLVNFFFAMPYTIWRRRRDEVTQDAHA